MNEREYLREIAHRMVRVERILLQLLHGLVGAQPPSLTPPAAGILTATLNLGATMSSTALVAVPPVVREDGTALPAADIESITFQKVPAGSAAGTATEHLVTNAGAAGVGLSAAECEYTDATAAVGDVYSFYVTDIAGTVGASSNTYTNEAAAGGGGALSPPGPGEISGTFTP